MITPTYYALIGIYYIVLFIGFFGLIVLLIYIFNFLLGFAATKIRSIWMAVEYFYYRKEFKEFFKDKSSQTGLFNKK